MKDNGARSGMESRQISGQVQQNVAACRPPSSDTLNSLVGRCRFCDRERQLKAGCEKQRWKVCRDHFRATCPKCGHEAYWMENMRAGSYYLCFSLECSWRSRVPPNYVIRED